MSSTNPFTLFLVKEQALCTDDDVTNCSSVQRLRSVLDKDDDEHYPTVSILDDFFHLRFHHNIDIDHAAFHLVFQQFQPCDLSTCAHISGHFRDRCIDDETITVDASASGNDEYNDLYRRDVLHRIHAYLLHSYDINRFTPEELKQIDTHDNEDADDGDANDDDDNDDDADEQDTKYDDDDEDDSKGNHHNNNGVAKQQAPKHDQQRLQHMHSLLQRKKQTCVLSHAMDASYLTTLRRKFLQPADNFNYTRDRIKQLIHSRDANDEASSSQLVPAEHSEKQDKITDFIAFTQAESSVATQFLKAFDWDALSAVDRYFLYNGDVMRLPTAARRNVARDADDPEVQKQNSEQKEEEHVFKNDATFHVGVEFNFSTDLLAVSTRYQIEPKFDSLKSELLHNARFECTLPQWNRLHAECEVMIGTDCVKKITSKLSPYGVRQSDHIKVGSKLSINQILAGKLYAEYGAWSSALREVFRVQVQDTMSTLKQRIGVFGHWCRLLLELVQCYGDGGGGDAYGDKSRFYRVVDAQYAFHKFVGCFNVPISVTTMDVCQQLMDDSGIILTLDKSGSGSDSRFFDFSVLSCFDAEHEILFYRDSVFDIVGLYRTMNPNGLLVDYTPYVQALDCVIKLIHGTDITQHVMCTRARRIMQQILTARIHNTNSGGGAAAAAAAGGAGALVDSSSDDDDDDPSGDEETESKQAAADGHDTSALPAYVQNMWDKISRYHLPEQIMYHYENIVDSGAYSWLQHLFLKPAEKTINMVNLCRLFPACNTVVFVMPAGFVMDDRFCFSLIDDLRQIDTATVIMLKWSTPILLRNHSVLDHYRSQFNKIQWKFAFLSSMYYKFTAMPAQPLMLGADIDANTHPADLYLPNMHPSSHHHNNMYGVTEEKKIPFLVHGFFRRFAHGLLVPAEIIKLTIAFYGNYHTIYWKIDTEQLQRILLHAEDEDEDLYVGRDEDLCSSVYTVHILEHVIRFQLKLKIEDDVGDDKTVLLSIHAVPDNDDDPSLKDVLTISYTMRCLETQCEYRHMDVISDTDGSGWFEDFLHLSEIKKLALTQLTMVCQIHVLHIWSQRDEDDDHPVELMNIYHSGTQMMQRVEYKWALSTVKIPSNVCTEYTMWYSDRFDGRNWTAIFVERETNDDFLVGMKLLEVPFGIGLLMVQFDIVIRRARTDRFVHDCVVEQFKYGDDDKGIAETKEFMKEDLFGADLFSVAELIVDIKVEVLHVEGVNEEQIFRINWPLFGILCGDEKGHEVTPHNFVCTKDQFENEQFGTSYMVGVLQHELKYLKQRVRQLEDKEYSKSSNGRRGQQRSVNQEQKEEVHSEEIRRWLTTTCDLPDYYGLFMRNGFHSLELVKEISGYADLEYIGVTVKAHQIKLMNKIRSLTID